MTPGTNIHYDLFFTQEGDRVKRIKCDNEDHNDIDTPQWSRFIVCARHDVHKPLTDLSPFSS